MKRSSKELPGKKLTIGAIVNLENRLNYYKIVGIKDDVYDLKEIKDPYSLLYFSTLSKIKSVLSRPLKTHFFRK